MQQILSVIIPVYNEFGTLCEILTKVRNTVLPEGVRKEIIIIDDGSTDSTREYLSTVKAPDIVIFQPKNQGKGAAVRAGLSAATGDYLVIQDADLEYEPEEYPILLSPLLDGSADVVYGSRFLKGYRHSGTAWWHYCINRLLTFLSNALSGLSLSDMETCYKIFTRKVAEEIGPALVSSGFEIEAEITARIAHAEYRLSEVPISYHYRPFSKGKKIGWKDGIETIWAIMRFNIADRR